MEGRFWKREALFTGVRRVLNSARSRSGAWGQSGCRGCTAQVWPPPGPSGLAARPKDLWPLLCSVNARMVQARGVSSASAAGVGGWHCTGHIRPDARGDG